MRWWTRLECEAAHYMQERSGTLACLTVLFVAGALFGSLAVGALGSEDKAELVQLLGGFLEAVAGGAVPGGGAAFRAIHPIEMRALAMHWLLGLSVVGSLGVMVAVFLRGFATGFSVGFMASELGLRGVFAALAAVLPGCLFSVPALLVVSTGAVHFSLQVVKSRLRGRRLHFYRELLHLSGAGALGAVLYTGAALVQAFLSPALLRVLQLLP